MVHSTVTIINSVCDSGERGTFPFPKGIVELFHVRTFLFEIKDEVSPMAFKFTPGKTVEVPQIDYAGNILLPARESVLLVVDMQNDFVHPDGNLVVGAAAETVPVIQKLLESARQLGVRIVYTQDTHFPDDPEWKIWPVHCEKETWGWRIIDELQPERSDLVCQKNRYDGFYQTWLEHFLSHQWDIKHLVIVGTVANICVAHTAASAGLRWYHVVVPANGISALTQFDQALALRQISTLYAGDVVETAGQIKFELHEPQLNQSAVATESLT
jgi:nicotinamidase-related amidase